MTNEQTQSRHNASFYDMMCTCVCVCITTCHTQYTWDSSICVFLFNRTTLQFFVTYLTGALYVHPLWFYKHQHDNGVRSKLFVAMSAVMVSVAVVIRTFSSSIHTHPVSWNCAYHLRMKLSDGGCFPNWVRNCRWTIVPRTIILNNPVY